MSFSGTYIVVYLSIGASHPQGLLSKHGTRSIIRQNLLLLVYLALIRGHTTK